MKEKHKAFMRSLQADLGRLSYAYAALADKLTMLTERVKKLERDAPVPAEDAPPRWLKT